MAHLLKWILVPASLVFGSSPTPAHDWYPTVCCSDKDCRALIEENGETVTEATPGWQLWDGRTIEHNFAGLSPDGQFHLCEAPSRRIICFFAPPRGS